MRLRTTARPALRCRHDQFQTLEIVAIEGRVAGNEAIALQQRMRTDQEVGHRAPAAYPLPVAPLHLARAHRRFGFQRHVANAHVLEHGQGFGAVAQRAAHLGQGHLATHDRPGDQALAQADFGGIGFRPAGQQVHQHRGIDGDHFPPCPPSSGTGDSPGARPRSAPMASSVLANPWSSRKRPRAREMASSTLLRNTIRPFSSSTFRTLPLLSPSASRTALGKVIWPRSATMTSMAGSLGVACMERAYILYFAYSNRHTMRLPSATTVSIPARAARPQPLEP